MASFEITGFDKLIQGLEKLDFDEVAPKMLKEAAPILQNNLKNRSATHTDTGSMAGSIGTGRLKQKNDGYMISVRPTGTDNKGVRNMEKMCYLEYGTYKQAATPVLSPAVAESQDPCIDAMQKVFDEYTKEIAL